MHMLDDVNNINPVIHVMHVLASIQVAHSDMQGKQLPSFKKYFGMHLVHSMELQDSHELLQSIQTNY
jgi:hypothetical protein